MVAVGDAGRRRVRGGVAPRTSRSADIRFEPRRLDMRTGRTSRGQRRFRDGTSRTHPKAPGRVARPCGSARPRRSRERHGFPESHRSAQRLSAGRHRHRTRRDVLRGITRHRRDLSGRRSHGRWSCDQRRKRWCVGRGARGGRQEAGVRRGWRDGRGPRHRRSHRKAAGHVSAHDRRGVRQRRRHRLWERVVHRLVEPGVVSRAARSGAR